MESKDVTLFVRKWMRKFNDEGSTPEDLAGADLAEDCEAMGFEMDSGNSFFEKYAVCPGDLPKILQQADDYQILGNAIYSEWRFYNHWSYSPSEICEREARQWFIAALQRLEDIA